MIYKVKAKFINDKSKEFLQKLTDGTIKNQMPDGQEIIDSMNRATIDENDFINWTELCFCPTPLKHERSTIYDNFFKEMQTEPTKNHEIIRGVSFMDHLSNL